MLFGANNRINLGTGGLITAAEAALAMSARRPDHALWLDADHPSIMTPDGLATIRNTTL